MRLLFVFVFLSSLAFGQKKDKQPNCNVISGIEISKYGEVWTFIDEKNTYTGLVKFCDENDKVDTYYTIKNGKVDGEAKRWHKNGHIWWSEIFENNKTKSRELYNDKGFIISKVYLYPDSNIIARGTYYKWYDNGKCKSKENKLIFKDEDGREIEVFDGFQKEWFVNGQLSNEGEYKFDEKTYKYSSFQIFTHKKWYLSGQLKQEINYDNLGSEKSSKIWYNNGQIKKLFSIEKGDWKEKCWDKNGNEIECDF